jgi:hypothetical protein
VPDLCRALQRLESLVFRTGYIAFRWLHCFLASLSPGGNFSIVPSGLLPRLVTMPELWNHYETLCTSANWRLSSHPLTPGNAYREALT